MADRGSEGSRVHKNHGLFYRILDEKGNTIGVPIKASSFYNKPTLKYLEEKFVKNETARQSHKARVKNAIDLALLKLPKKSLDSLVTALEKEGIKAVLRQNKEGIIYGLTYVDHRTKCVFNGSDLGKQYSAKGIQERCSEHGELKQDERYQNQQPNNHQFRENYSPIKDQTSIKDLLASANVGKAAEELLQPAQGGTFVPHQFKKRKKKKRETISNNQ
jgi:hypothetical protein